MNNLKLITNTTTYVPIEWGTKIEGAGNKITAFVHFVDNSVDATYEFYGRDADVYREFEKAGFIREQEVENFEEADAWIKGQVFRG